MSSGETSVLFSCCITPAQQKCSCVRSELRHVSLADSYLTDLAVLTSSLADSCLTDLAVLTSSLADSCLTDLAVLTSSLADSCLTDLACLQKSLVNIEVARIRTRLQGHYSNPVWGSRTEPPADWSAPLPPVLHQRALDSSFTATDVAASDTLAACGGDDTHTHVADTPTRVADTPTRVAETPAADRSKSRLANLVPF
ncbi:hypothetical protein FHG87_019673 [Trinorchestia longiramus]|nr:hypothetical protein FHG87_019673 [Trinorchestia longiramus]